MADSALILRDRDGSHRTQIGHRDWMLINGPGFLEGPAFIKAFGIFDNHTLARGIPEGSTVSRDGQVLFDAASLLLAGITRDFRLMTYDYSVKVGNELRQFGGGKGISVGGRGGCLSLLPKGYCSIQFDDQQTPALIDLRDKDGFVSDRGPVKLYRRRAQSSWKLLLPPLIDFLRTRRARIIEIEHVDKVIK